MTASAKKAEMTTGGDVGSSLKMWLISGRFPYRTGESGIENGALGSRTTLSEKALLLYGADDPKEAIISSAEIGD